MNIAKIATQGIKSFCADILLKQRRNPPSQASLQCRLRAGKYSGRPWLRMNLDQPYDGDEVFKIPEPADQIKGDSFSPVDYSAGNAYKNKNI